MVLEEHNELELAGIRFQIGIFEEALHKDAGNTEALRYLSHAYSVVGRVEDALAADRRLVAKLPRDPRARYNLACSLALSGRRDDALTTLEQACDLGFDDVTLLEKDRDLDGLREDARFEAIRQRISRGG